jgi:hypothetical protein
VPGRIEADGQQLALGQPGQHRRGLLGGAAEVGQPQRDALRRVGRDPPHRDPLDRFDPVRLRASRLRSAVEIREIIRFHRFLRHRHSPGM